MIRLLNSILAAVWWIYTLPNNYDQERRNSKKYKKKKDIVKNVWIVSGSIMIAFLQFPLLLGIGACCVLGMLTTFLGFMILDETP